MAYGYLSGQSVADPSLYPPNLKSLKDTHGLSNGSSAAGQKGRGTESALTPAVPPTIPQKRKLMDVVIETVYENAMFDDDNVQLQVVKVLLTSVTSVNCQVRDPVRLLFCVWSFHFFDLFVNYFISMIFNLMILYVQ